MLSKRRIAMDNIAPRLFALEDAIDDAILQSARFASTLIEERRRAGLSAVVGQGALERSTAAFTTLIAARGEMVATHHELAALKEKIGLRAVMMGAGGDKPDSPQPLGVVPLDAVA